MAPSDPLHGVPVTLSEETRAVVNCIIVRMMQVVARLLSRPDHAPARQEDLDALLLQETVTAITEGGCHPPPNPRDPRLRSLHSADHHHHDGGTPC